MQSEFGYWRGPVFLLPKRWDWQQLIEMCRVVDTGLVDQETIYAPRHANDRLLLGLKGSLNEYELDQTIDDHREALRSLRRHARRARARLRYRRVTPSLGT